MLLVGCVVCGCAQSPRVRTVYQTVVIPESFVTPQSGTTQLAPVARGTIRLGSVDTASSLPSTPAAPAAEGQPPAAQGGGPASPLPARQRARPVSYTHLTLPTSDLV